ncbi:unnamed protein product, partial [Adineta steineri]
MEPNNLPISTIETEISLNDEHEVSRNVYIQTNLTAKRLDDELENYREHIQTIDISTQTVSTDIDIQAASTDIVVDNNVTNERQQARNQRGNARNNPATQLNGTNENVNQEVTRGERQTGRSVANPNTDRNRSNQRNRHNTKKVNKENLKSDGKDPSPILGYAEEPLLPLAQACAPLNDIFHNLSFYVDVALKETPEQPPDGLTINESAAIRLYTIEWDKPHRSLYSTLNYNLKNNDRQALLPFFKYLKLFLTALVKLPCVPPLTVWRGVTMNLSEEFPPGSAM